MPASFCKLFLITENGFKTKSFQKIKCDIIKQVCYCPALEFNLKIGVKRWGKGNELYVYFDAPLSIYFELLISRQTNC